MELIDAIKEILSLVKVIEGETDEDDDFLERIYHICETAIIDYKIKQRVESEPQNEQPSENEQPSNTAVP